MDILSEEEVSYYKKSLISQEGSGDDANLLI